jgi:hypothetical protein
MGRNVNEMVIFRDLDDFLTLCGCYNRFIRLSLKVWINHGMDMDTTKTMYVQLFTRGWTWEETSMKW